MKVRIIICIVITKFIFFVNRVSCQDPNLSRVFDLKNYSIEYDSIKKYYPAFQIHYNDTLAGFVLTNYHGYDSLFLHLDYTSSILINHKYINKGMCYQIRPEGTFFDLYFYDWSGKQHGNQMTFYPDGSVKLNEVWDRGKLLKHWQYGKRGELIEYKEF